MLHVWEYGNSCCSSMGITWQCLPHLFSLCLAAVVSTESLYPVYSIYALFTYHVDTTDVFKEGDIRLVDGDSDSEGRLEVYHNELWGTVCDDLFDLDSARVACRQLGFTDVLSWESSFSYADANGPIGIHSVQCDGDEESLLNCSFRDDLDTYLCFHFEDVRISCSGTYVHEELYEYNELHYTYIYKYICTDSMYLYCSL